MHDKVIYDNGRSTLNKASYRIPDHVEGFEDANNMNMSETSMSMSNKTKKLNHS